MKQTILKILPILILPNICMSQSDTLKIEITGFRNSNAKAIIAIHDDEKSFPAKVSCAYRKYAVKIINNRIKTHITDLPHGRYAVVVCHDENSDYKLNTNFLGFPTEGTAIYNKNKGMPNFKKSCFNFPATSDLHMKIKYY